MKQRLKMSNRNLLEGTWHFFEDERQFNIKPLGCRVSKGKFRGDGWYLELKYTERCSRNCCDDYCVEKIRPEDVVKEVREMMRDCEFLLKEAQEKRGG